jgi:hypothetical protein
MSPAAQENGLLSSAARTRGRTQFGILSTEIDYAIEATKLPHERPRCAKIRRGILRTYGNFSEIARRRLATGSPSRPWRSRRAGRACRS